MNCDLEYHIIYYSSSYGGCDTRFDFIMTDEYDRSLIVPQIYRDNGFFVFWNEVRQYINEGCYINFSISSNMRMKVFDPPMTIEVESYKNLHIESSSILFAAMDNFKRIDVPYEYDPMMPDPSINLMFPNVRCLYNRSNFECLVYNNCPHLIHVVGNFKFVGCDCNFRNKSSLIV